MGPREFYDWFVERQLRVGVNRRHRSILRYLLRFGLEPHHRVLEIGAGVGTLTGLIADELGPTGRLLAVDLSPRSIEVARERLAGVPGLDLRAEDVFEMEPEGVFDVVVLPDVLEHIPTPRRGKLFARLAEWVAPGGFVLLHYPNPRHLAWFQEHRPEDLQVVDEPVWADEMTADAYAAGFTLEYLETYSIWIREGDFQVALLKLRPVDPTFHAIEYRPSFMIRLREWLRLRLERVRG